MPSTNSFDYNLDLIQVNLDGFRATGFSSDDAVSIVKDSDDTQTDLSAEGRNAVHSVINDNMHTVTIRVQRGSAGYKRISDAYEKQKRQASRGAVPAMAFSVYDPISGDSFTERAIRFKKGPDMPFGKTNGEAVFILTASNPDIVRGENIVTAV